jgi:starch phosphorylase
VKAIRRLTVRSVLPEALAALRELSGNLRWSWHEPTRELFAAIDPELWQQTHHDPIAVLAGASADRLQQLAGDSDYLDALARQRDELRGYLDQPRWYQSLDERAPACIAYFSPEFGIAAALPQYSGGLGILAGDHLKSASDLGLPLVGVGLFYRSGYFAQAISASGWQEESYPALEADGLPLTTLQRADGSTVLITLALTDGRVLHARILQAAVGRVRLLLLDTDIDENDETLRAVTDRLYGGTGEHRLLQELLLGIGGARAVEEWATISGAPRPEIFHTNEGHAGFQGVERISRLIGEGLDFGQALQLVRASTVFTTHTPVAAGIDRFDRSLVERYLTGDLLPGVSAADVLAPGEENYEGGSAGVFNMAVMGLRLGQHANGVSKLHGEVSRGMFGGLWPGFDAAEVPIDSVTNGVHAPTWTDPMLRALAEERFGNPDTTTVDWRSDALSDGDLWTVRGRMRQQMVDDARRRVTASYGRRAPGGIAPGWVAEMLDPAVLTIGFARRVPTYKRLTLMLHDPDRLRAILLNAERPVQLVIAGKAHPADEEGKRLIQQMVQFAATPELRTRMVFLPDYDIAMAQQLYPGTDVWLNNPLRPLEACGTSGMKAALNGGLNLSILDGWWNEFYDGENGWAIASADGDGDGAERDAIEADALYDLIENQIVPRFYDRNADGVPERWVQAIRHTLATLSPALSADRMVREYVERFYVPATALQRALRADGYQPARDLAAWKARVSDAWPGVAVVHVDANSESRLGEELRVDARVRLNGLTPSDVSVQLVYGRTGSGDELTDARTHELQQVPGSEFPAEADELEYRGTLPLDHTGAFGYTVRIVPRNALLISPAELALVAYAG